MKQSIQKGFTLIELMIVVAIIGILASVALPAYREYIINSQMASAFSSTSIVQTAITNNYSRLGENWIQNIPAGTLVPCAYNAVSGANNCWTTQLGLRAAPDANNIEGVDGVALVAGTDPTAVANTCAGFPLNNAPAAGVVIPAIQYEINFDATIDPDIAGTVNLIPVVNPARPQTLGWIASTTGTLNAGADLAGVACKWIHENINSDWI